MMIAVLFSGCKKNNNVDDNNISEKKAQSKNKREILKILM
ncbi:polysaccharide deacetylase [Clostridium botulinum CFSAN002367]|nr:polysaccharide deacetylase [Clostridium botulinum CFSAN002369]EPS51609.1 polysaccharide deacetylase [Clostridium botulinum CFSAN002367]